MYIYSLYFSIMTITSVGYGDVSATAFNVWEQIICCLIMLISGNPKPSPNPNPDPNPKPNPKPDHAHLGHA